MSIDGTARSDGSHLWKWRGQWGGTAEFRGDAAHAAPACAALAHLLLDWVSDGGYSALLNALEESTPTVRVEAKVDDGAGSGGSGGGGDEGGTDPDDDSDDDDDGGDDGNGDDGDG